MKKLIFHWNYGTCEFDCGQSTIVFEYSSKENFILDVWNKFNKKWFETHSISFPFGDSGPYMLKEDLDDLEKYVFTIEEFFEQNKVKIDL